MNNTCRVLSSLGLLGGIWVFALPGSPPAAVAEEAVPAYAPGEVIVQFKRDAAASQRDAALSRAGAAAREHIRTEAMQAEGAPGLAVASTRLPVMEAIRALKNHPAVEFAEPNWIMRHAATSNDPYFTGGQLWGMYGDESSPANTYGSGAGEAWAAGQTGADTVYVGIIDEGVQITHPELQPNAWTNPYDPVDGVDNDGNGYVDDVNGWDFYNRDRTVYDSTGDDHGTHVAGTIGARGGNGAGVAGVVWNVRFIAAKFLGPQGGYLSDAVKAVDYFTHLKRKHGLNIVATNNSWGGGGYSQALHDAILRAARENILFVAAAGNGGSDGIGDNNDTAASYPSSYDTSQGTSTEPAAGYDAVIAVAAIDRYGSVASFSNYGGSTVDLGAPGVGIYSTLPSNSYGSYSGTSMATPHVTGAAALFAAAYPGTTGPDLKSAILNTVAPTASLAGKTATGGRLNVGDGFSPIVTPVHDVAVASVTAPASVTLGSSATVAVAVKNEGSAAETVAVSLANTPPAGGTPGAVSSAQSIVVSAGATATLSFTWSTAGASAGTHTLTASAAPVAEETDTADNSRSTTASVVAPEAQLALSSITPASLRRGSAINVTVAGTGLAAGARLTFQNGEGATPQASNVAVSADGTMLTARVSVGTRGPKRNRYWDVVVTNPNGQTARIVRGFTVTP